MITITPKTGSYTPEKNKAMSIIQHKKLIVWLPTALIVVLGVVLAIVAQVYCLIISVLGLLYVPIIMAVMGKQFKALNKTIKDKFFKHCKPSANGQYAVLVKDNKSFAASIGENGLYAWMTADSIRYISTSLFNIDKLELKSTSYENYCSIMKKDFGIMIVPLAEIDHYRDNTLVCSCGTEITRLSFADDKALDTFIPQKEYYYSSEKKDGRPE